MTRPIGALKQMPSAGDVARVVVTAAHLLAEDPLHIVQQAAASKACCYAYVALRRLFPTITHAACVRLVGKDSHKRSVETTLLRADMQPWFDADLLRFVIWSVNPAWREPPPARPRRTVVQPTVSLTAVICGDPLPGRSALDQKRGVAA